MKILIVSDTHRDNSNYLKVIEKEKPIDMFIHCGDIEGTEYVFQETTGCPVYMVAGNNDFFSPLKMELEFEIEGYKVFLTHGHHYHISRGDDYLRDAARSRGADILIYGHTHRPVVDLESDIVVINPGSLSYPRQEGRRPTYVVMEIDDKGDISAEIRYA